MVIPDVMEKYLTFCFRFRILHEKADRNTCHASATKNITSLSKRPFRKYILPNIATQMEYVD